jgi:voltage-gated potassium channel
MVAVLTIVTIVGSLMYLVESQANSGFSSIPASIYWAIVTVTTVGFGDITPQTGLGQFLAAILMILGYAIIAVPTGIVSVEIARADRHLNTQSCPHCTAEGHKDNALHCFRCGGKLND